MVTPDPRRGDEPNPDGIDINGSAPQPEDDGESDDRNGTDNGVRGQQGPTADYGEG